MMPAEGRGGRCVVDFSSPAGMGGGSLGASIDFISADFPLLSGQRHFRLCIDAAEVIFDVLAGRC